MQSALESVDGVESAAFDFKTKKATVMARDGVDQKALIAALKEKNYGAEVLD